MKEELERLKRQVRNLEDDLHNRIRACEKRLAIIEKAGDELIDRADDADLEIGVLLARLNARERNK
jgi:endo-alpha-1,4-polygalactosaminidase (GH114 family)